MKTILTGLPMYGYWPGSVFMYVRRIEVCVCARMVCVCVWGVCACWVCVRVGCVCVWGVCACGVCVRGAPFSSLISHKLCASLGYCIYGTKEDKKRCHSIVKCFKILSRTKVMHQSVSIQFQPF